jgi:hypothetical protein
MSAGSEVPSLGKAYDFAGARRSGFWQCLAWSALVLLPCLVMQGCGISDQKIMAGDDAAMQRPAFTKGDFLISRPGQPELAPGRVDSFSDRYAAAVGSYAPKSARSASAPGSYKVASLSPDVPYGLPAIKQGQTQLIGFENSAFPYHGKGRAYSEGKRYSDNHVLLHVPTGFDVRKPGVIVVFFHGHGATLARDVRDRQLLPKQISESGVNAVLVAPQLAYDAADSSAGKLWERGGFKRFMAEAAEQLARLYGDPRATEAFAKMPVIVVSYSGGFVTAAYSLQVGGLGNRVRGLVLLDSLYGEMDKFSSWIVKNRSAFFIASDTQSTKRHDDDLERILRGKGIPIAHELNGPLKPGTVAFLHTGSGITHRDYVTLAWTDHPVRDVLLRISR